MKIKPFWNRLLPVALGVLLGMIAQGQPLIYTPTNPAFGGNYLNYSWLLNSANSQNRLTDPNAPSAFGQEEDELEAFKESINRQLLSQLSREIFSNQFGEDFLSKEGVYQYGDYQVEVSPGLDGLLITIFDLGTGGSTSMTIPYY